MLHSFSAVSTSGTVTAVRTATGATDSTVTPRVRERLEVLQREEAKNDGDAVAMEVQRDELKERLEEAEFDSMVTEDSTLSCAFMQERLKMKRPHLERKRAFLTSRLIEMTVRHETQDEAPMPMSIAPGTRHTIKTAMSNVVAREIKSGDNFRV